MTKIEMIITVRFGDGIGVVSGVTMPIMSISAGSSEVGVMPSIYRCGRAQARGLSIQSSFNAAALPVARCQSVYPLARSAFLRRSLTRLSD